MNIQKRDQAMRHQVGGKAKSSNQSTMVNKGLSKKINLERRRVRKEVGNREVKARAAGN